jgi:hypothetical protein
MSARSAIAWHPGARRHSDWRQGAWRRALIAGTAWGAVMGGVLTALEAWRCGFVCVPDAALTTAFSIAAGLCTMGPLAAFGARRPAQER